MKAIIKNNKISYGKHVIIEKENFKVNEMTFLDILCVEYGFMPKISERPLTQSQKILKSFGVYIKKAKVHCFDVYISNINGHQFEVAFDTWRVTLRKNEITIFDSSDNFNFDDFFKLLI
jgi:hypothetical protein